MKRERERERRDGYEERMNEEMKKSEQLVVTNYI